MPQARTLAVAAVCLPLLFGLALAPAPWHLVTAACCVVVPTAVAAWLPARRTSHHPVSSHRVHLELRIGRVAVSRYPGPGTDAPTLAPSTPFPLQILSTVLDSGAEWAAPIRRWQLVGTTEATIAEHPAAATYRTLLGPLDIPGRRRFLLTLDIDPLALPPGGSVASATAHLATCVATHLTHHRIWARLVDDRLAADIQDRGTCCAAGSPGAERPAAPEKEAGGPTVVPGIGAGPVLGADAEDRAVCLDLAGPHLRHVVWVGPRDALTSPLVRCAALGWRAAVVTDTPQQWRGLAEAAGWPLHLAADLDPALPARWSSSCGGTDGHGGIDAVLWDCALGPETVLRRPPGADPTPTPTLWQVVAQPSAGREAALREAAAAHPDLVVDARVAGWLTVETARRADGEEGPRITVQAVQIPAEEALIAAAARRPQDSDILAV